MSEPYGASFDEWTHWANTLHLREDLLPVVCRPGQSIASTSKLQEYGKVPCRYSSRQEVVGFPKWTSHHATVPEVRAWRDQPDYGICLQTRNVRALDVDVEDPAVADEIWKSINRHFPGGFSRRFRADSSKFLVLFQFGWTGPLGKRMMKVPGGLIEFLADGQQCLVAGTHPKGARYEWECEGMLDDEPTPIEATLEDFDYFWAELTLELATEDPTEARPKTIRGAVDQRVGSSSVEGRNADRSGSHASSDDSQSEGRPLADPIVTLLVAQNLYTGEAGDGRIYFTCPWKHEHTKQSDITETVYFPAGTGGFEQGHFSCLHAHCVGRTDADFLNAIGWTLRGFEDVAVGPGLSVDETSGSVDAGALRAFGLEPGTEGHGAKPVEPETPPLAVVGRNIKTGVIPATSRNMVVALERPDVTGVIVRYDTFTNRLLYGSNPDALAPINDHDYTHIGILLSKLHFDPKLYRQTLRDAVRLVAKNKSFDSGLDWASKLPAWDGVSRIERFYPDYLHTEDTEYSRAVGLYQWTAMAGRLLCPGIKADMVPVWISGEGTGKSTSIMSLVVSPDQYVEINLSDDHKDLARTMCGKLIGELSELRGIRGRDLEWTKAFITRQVEEWVPKFQEERTTYPRRLLFIGTSNREDFLISGQANRRWLPIMVGERQDVARIVQDRLQLWAEGIARFNRDGVVWNDAQRTGRGEHHRYVVGDVWEEPVTRYLFEPGLDGVAPVHRPYITTWEILRDGLNKDAKAASQFDAIRIAGVLRKLGYEERRVRDGGKQFRAWFQELL